MVSGFHHTGRTVSDMEASLAFYRDLLGLKLVDDAVISDEAMARFLGLESIDLRAVMLSPDGSPPYLELFAFATPGGSEEAQSRRPHDPGSSHPCFLVDDIEAEYHRLLAAGVRFTRPPMQIDEGPFSGQWILYGFDPDGAIVEFWSSP